MTYTPRRMDRLDVIAHLADHPGDELVQWQVAADRLGVPLGTVATWMDRGQVRVIHVAGRRHVLMGEASEVEYRLRTTRGPGRRRA